MRFLTTNDIVTWASTVDCRYHLPQLIRKLILATIDNSTIKNIHFPYGEDVQTGGFDGELLTESGNMFVPFGESVWEIGTTDKKKEKADDDYDKRKQDTLGKISTETTYLNVNAKKYRDKKKWVAGKKNDAFWRDVRYIDAVDIEQWLELAPEVELWLAEKLKKSTLGIYTAEEYWKLWSQNESLQIVPEILLGNSRSKEIEVVKSFLENEQKILYIKSITTDESLAFPLAILKKINCLSIDKMVVIDNRESFNQFIQTNKPLVILSKFQIENIDLRGAIQNGHKIIIPLSLADEVASSEQIQLPIVSRETFEIALKKMDIDSEQVRILTKNSGRNISVLKRLLKFGGTITPKYLEKVSIKDIIPILIINRFSENFNGDKEVIEKLSGKTSEEYIQFLKILVTLEDSPVYYINGVWRLISPTDTWLYFAKYITEQDLTNFSSICLNLLREISYKYTLPLKDRGTLISTPQNRSKYSSQAKEGLCESLTVISVFGENYGINSISTVSSYIDNIIQKIFEMDVSVWRSLSNNIMLLAEASPNVFLNNLERIIKDRSIKAFFELEKDFLGSSNDLAPLLFCLDIVAWFPEHLMRASTALCEMILISPKSFPTANTPLGNLKSIYRPWYPQTNTNAEGRKKIIETLVRKYPDTLHQLLNSLIRAQRDTAFHTPRPKWRLFSQLRKVQVISQEFYDMNAFFINKLIEISANNTNSILTLIDLLGYMEFSQITMALDVIEMNTSSTIEDKTQIYHKFRKFIGKHRSYPTANWSLPANILEKIEQTAIQFIAADNILHESYLFEEIHPVFIEGSKGKGYSKQNEEISLRRLAFVDAIIVEYGINKIFELSSQIEHPNLYGKVLALSDKVSPKDKESIYKLLESENKSLLAVVVEFIRTSENITDLNTQTDILNRLIQSKLSPLGIVNFLNSLRDRIDLWRFISDMKHEEVEKLYWKAKFDLVYTENKEELFYALSKLQDYRKSFTLLNTLSWGTSENKNTLTSDEILTILEQVSLTDFEDSSNFHFSTFSNLLELLYTRNDYDVERGAKIEMKFIHVFARGPYSSIPKNYFKLISQRPDEYFGLLSCVYLPEDDELYVFKLN